jgi:hypothetical protein
VRTYGKLHLIDGQWAMTELEPHVAIRLKAVFPKVPKHARGVIRFPADPMTAADIAWFMSRYPLAVDPAAQEKLDLDRAAFEGQQAEVGRIMSADYVPPAFSGLKPGQSVRLHQARAAELLSRFGGLLVADDMGEGKTYTGGRVLPDARRAARHRGLPAAPQGPVEARSSPSSPR